MIKNKPLGGTIYTVFACLFMLFLLWFIIFITDSERRIPVQYAKKVVGRKMYGGQSSNLPIKLNMTGVMPIIFANAILTLPATIAMLFDTPKEGTFWHGFLNIFASTSWVYVVLQFVLIVAFAYFYVAISFNPIEVSGNLQKNGGSIPGIRPGKATSTFIQKVLSKITFIGALALSVIAVIPLMINVVLEWIRMSNGGEVNIAFWAFSYLGELATIGTSIIIVVGVVLEIIREMEAQMTMRHYKGFLG
jgi:preprotein translocase subunit SecY